MPGSKRQRTDLKTSIQQRQEQQRQGVTVQFQPDSSDRHDRFASQMALHDTPEQAFAAYDAQHPAPSLPEVRARLDAELAHLPRQATGPLTVDEEEALDLLHALIDRIPHAQLECRVELLARAARAAVRAIREER